MYCVKAKKFYKAQEGYCGAVSLLSVVAKAANDKRLLASQAARQIIKHTLSSELEGVLHYMPVACRRLPLLFLLWLVITHIPQ